MTDVYAKLNRAADAYERARAKHPFFADRFTDLEPLAAIDFRLRTQERNDGRDKYYADDILSEETAEVVDAYLNRGLDATLAEIYDAIAVLLRMADMVEGEMDAHYSDGGADA